MLVHGWALSSRAFALQLPLLSAAGRAIAIDLRGHGLTPAPPRPHGIAEHAADLAALFERLDLRDALLVGWSVGGQVALAALPALAARVDALVLLGASPCFTRREDWPHGTPDEKVRTLGARLAAAPEPTLARFFENLFAPGELEPGALSELRRVVLEGVPSPSLPGLQALLDDLVAVDQRGALASVRTPTLVIHGELDRTCSSGAGEALAGGIRGARLVLLPGLGHAPQLSRPALVSELVLRFREEV